MAIPNGGLITETNEQYYAGSQRFLCEDAYGTSVFVATFNTDLIFGSYDPSSTDYALNNFALYTSPTSLPGSYTEYTLEFTVKDNVITTTTPIPVNTYVVVQLKTLDGGKYGDENAYGDIVQQNQGGYAYTSLSDIIDAFMAIYVGEGKLILDVKRTDVIFHAKRGLQEFSYDTLKTIRSQELTVPANLNLAVPQDYVNYTAISRIDSAGVKRPIFPANTLHVSPYQVPLQDGIGQITTDNFGDQLEGSSITNERWANANASLLAGNISRQQYNDIVDTLSFDLAAGQRYGGDPQYMQSGGWFNMNERDGTIMFSSNLRDKLIVLEYISDGLAYEGLDFKVPKMAEEALYAHISHAIISTRMGQPEYIVQRLKRERYAKLRNAKIRLSNIKLSEIVQVMRGKSKWIK
jgi:hypothetical protein